MTIYEMLLMAILGHFVGDYLFQSTSMALHKTDRTFTGWWVCVGHCLVYAFSVSALIGLGKTINPWVFGMVFLSHYPIDRYSLGQKWLDLIGGRDFMNDWRPALKQDQEFRPGDIGGEDDLRTLIITTSFGCIVYTITDNTLHIVLMWIGICLLNNNGLV